MAEEEEVQETPESLYYSFPNYDKNQLQCLTPWPTGDEYYGQYFADLYYPASNDELVPSVLSKDPFMRTIARVRSTYAFVTLLQESGAFGKKGRPLQTVSNAIANFSTIYPLYCATIIQRAWRAKKKNSTKENRLKYGIAMIVRPTNGRYAEERASRRTTIADMLQIYPPQLPALK